MGWDLLQVVNNILSCLAVDLQHMLNADIMETIVYRSAAEKAMAHAITEPPPAYRREKTIILTNLYKKPTRLHGQQRIALHHFAMQHVPDYSQVRMFLITCMLSRPLTDLMVGGGVVFQTRSERRPPATTPKQH